MWRQAKTIAVSSFLGIYALIGFLFWMASSTSGDARALELFKEKKYQYAHVYVDELEKSSCEPRYALFQGYVLRAKSNLQDSDRFLQLAVHRAEKKGVPAKLLMEIYLNQALNAYLQEDGEKLQAVIQKAGKLKEPDYGWLNLFSSIYASKKEEKILEISSQQKRLFNYLSPWMEEAFTTQFDGNWFEIQEIRRLIDEGKFITARQKLEEKLESSDSDELYFLAGWSYFKEGQARPLNSALAYYKLAFSYFDHLHAKEKLHVREWKMITASLQASMHKLTYWGDTLFYFSLMEKLSPWVDQNKLVADLASALDQDADSQELIELIAASPFSKAMGEYYDAAARLALKQSEYARVESCHNLMQQLSRQEDGPVPGYLRQEILRVVRLDDSSLARTTPLVAIWNQVESESSKRKEFITTIIHEAGRMWSIYGDHKKAIVLMQLVGASCEKYELAYAHQLMETAVGDIYRSAVQCDKVDQYFNVMDAVSLLQLKEVDVYDRDETAYQLGDAEYYFGKHRYQEAKERALWVLRVDPQNQIANRIAGLIAYSEGHFDQALAFLKKLKKLDPEARAAIENTAHELLENNL